MQRYTFFVNYGCLPLNLLNFDFFSNHGPLLQEGAHLTFYYLSDKGFISHKRRASIGE